MALYVVYKPSTSEIVQVAENVRSLDESSRALGISIARVPRALEADARAGPTHVRMSESGIVGFVSERRPAEGFQRSAHHEGSRVVKLTALGDVIMSLPAVEAYSRLIGKRLIYLTHPSMVGFLSRLSFIERAVLSRRAFRYRHVQNLDPVGESVQPDDRIPRPELYAEHLGVPLNHRQMPDYAVTAPDELEWARYVVTGKPRPIIVLAPHAGTRFREWGQEQELIAAMPEAYFILVSSRRLPFTADNAMSLGQQTSVSALVALLREVDAAGVNDTGLMHLAGMIGLPYLAVFGGVHPPVEFVSMYDSVSYLTSSYQGESGTHDCVPCYNGTIHNCMGTPHEKWCHKAIAPEQVAHSLNQMLSSGRRFRSLPAVSPSERPVSKVALFTVEGLGGDLVKLNVFRQLSEMVRKQHPEAHITFVGRSPSPLFRHMDFIDSWQFLGHDVAKEDLAPDVYRQHDVTFDTRYAIQVLRRGGEWSGDSLRGFDSGKFIEDQLLSTLPDMYRCSSDGKRLRPYLLPCFPHPVRQAVLYGRLKSRMPYIVIANGTDSTFAQTQTKMIPPSVLMALIKCLRAAGVSTVQCGTKDVYYVEGGDSLNWIGKTSIQDMVWLLEHSIGCISNEGGTAHLSSQLEVPTAVITGPTDPRFWGYPMNLNLVAPRSQCPLRPCWYHPDIPMDVRMSWHIKCLDHEVNDAELKRGFPECMASYVHDIQDVCDQVVAHFDRGRPQ